MHLVLADATQRRERSGFSRVNGHIDMALEVRSTAPRANLIGLDGIHRRDPLDRSHAKPAAAWLTLSGSCGGVPYPRRLLLAHGQRASDGLAVLPR